MTSDTGQEPVKKRTWRLWKLLGWALILAVMGPVIMTLPWRWVAPPTSAFMLAARLGIGEPEPVEVVYRWVDMDHISPQMAIAVVAAEDQRFPSHHGFDFDSISKAMSESRKRLRGASTISQQVAKNLFLWSGRSFIRKGLEAYLTVFIELLWPKRRILEVYMNLSEFAPGIFGVGAASKAIFGKSAGALTLHEAAQLAAVLPNPKRLSAARPSAYVRERTAWIEEATRQLGGVGYLVGL